MDLRGLCYMPDSYTRVEHFLNDSQIQQVIQLYGSEAIIRMLKQMLLIREFEVRGEEAYLEGLIGGFYHSYIGQEAVATSLIANTGKDPWFFASYRCHGVAILLDVTLRSLAAELLGKSTGCALGRGGSMHMCAPKFPGGFGIVGGQIPLAAGAAFSMKYQHQNNIAVAFIGDGAVAQGVFHETLNFVALHELPLMLVIENNGWGMGTALCRALAKQPIGESQAASYGIKSFLLNGFDLFGCLQGFRDALTYMKEHQKPVVIECICSRFKGHSISDPNLYRSKQEMQELLKKDPILYVKNQLLAHKLLQEDSFNALRNQCKQEVLQAFQQAKSDPDPFVATLEEGVYA